MNEHEEMNIDRILRKQLGESNSAARSCSHYDENTVCAYLENRLPAPRAAEFERHMLACSGCREEVTRLSRLATVAASEEESQAPTPVLRPAAMTARKKSLATGVTAWRWAAAVASVLVAVGLPLYFYFAQPRQQPARRQAESQIAQQTAPPRVAAQPELKNAPLTEPSKAARAQPRRLMDHIPSRGWEVAVQASLAVPRASPLYSTAPETRERAESDQPKAAGQPVPATAEAAAGPRALEKERRATAVLPRYAEQIRKLILEQLAERAPDSSAAATTVVQMTLEKDGRVSRLRKLAFGQSKAPNTAETEKQRVALRILEQIKFPVFPADLARSQERIELIVSVVPVSK